MLCCYLVKYKIDCCVGENIWGCFKLLVNKCLNKLGQYGLNCCGKVFDFGMQLMVKQKFKFYYGDIIEKQFKVIFVEVVCCKGNMVENLIGLFELCFDVFVYCLKFVLIIFVVCQFVNYGYVIVNGIKINIGFYCLKLGDVVQVCEKFCNMVLVFEVLGFLECDILEYIEVELKIMIVIYVCMFELVDVLYVVQMELVQVVEYYFL